LRNQHIRFARAAIDVNARLHARTAQIGQYQARIVAAGERAAYAVTEAAGDSTEVTVEQPDTFPERGIAPAAVKVWVTGSVGQRISNACWPMTILAWIGAPSRYLRIDKYRKQTKKSRFG
jgi:hypothetical protein